MLVVSLSSIPPRFDKIRATLDSLVAQSAAIGKILLYIPIHYVRFPDWDGRLPEVPEGVEIRRTDTDLGPATKALAAVKEFRGQDVDILFCDDDRHYDRQWAQRYVDLARELPGTCLCQLGMQVGQVVDGSGERALQPRAVRTWRVTDIEFQLRYLWQDIRAGRQRKSIPQPSRRVFRKSGYVDIFEGCGGVLIRPEWFDDSAFDIPKCAFGVDDVWLSGMVARKGIPIWLMGNLLDPRDTAAEPHAPLARTMLDGADRQTQNRQAISYMRETFGLWP